MAERTLDLEGPALRVDTSSFAALDFDGLVRQIRGIGES